MPVKPSLMYLPSLPLFDFKLLATWLTIASLLVQKYEGDKQQPRKAPRMLMH